MRIRPCHQVKLLVSRLVKLPQLVARCRMHPVLQACEAYYQDDEDGDEELDVLLQENENRKREVLMVNPFGDQMVHEENAVMVTPKEFKDQKNAVNEVRLQRGLPPVRQKVDLNSVRRQTRCYGCNEPGHFSRDGKCDPVKKKAWQESRPQKSAGVRTFSTNCSSLWRIAWTAPARRTGRM